MKTNWKIALMCMAMLAMIACKSKNPADDPLGGGDPGTEYESPIKVNDQSVADWDALDPAYVAVSTIAEGALWDGVKMVKVYADKVYINWMMVYDPAKYAKHRDVDVMHLFMDIDHSEETGGYYDLFQDASADLMFEGSLYDEAGTAIPYSPNVSKWIGEINGIGWEGCWELVSSIKGQSQFVGDSIIEARIMRDYIPGKEKFNKDGFGFGITLTQNFQPDAVGFLPQGKSPDGELIGRKPMLYVKFAK